MEPKPDKECEERGDIVLLSEIMTNSRQPRQIKRTNRPFYV